jgi:membrane protein DedA with SNARE-associated domain
MGILASANLSGASGSAPLPGFLNSLAGPLDHYGYGAIALLLLLENIGVPVVPGELALIAGAIFAGTDRAGLNVVLVGVVAVIAVIVGAEIGYLIGKYAGRELVLRYGKYVLIKPHHLDRAEAIVSRYGGIVVIIARYIVGLREANGIIAGITQMRWFTFLIYNTIGACAWVATWLTIGYVAGDHIDSIYRDVNRFSLYVFVVLAVLLVGYIGWRLLRRRRAGRPGGGSPDPESAEAGEISGAGEASGTQEVSADGEASVAEVGESSAISGADAASDTDEVPEANSNSDAVEVPEANSNSDAVESSRAKDHSGTKEISMSDGVSGAGEVIVAGEVSAAGETQP